MIARGIRWTGLLGSVFIGMSLLVPVAGWSQETGTAVQAKRVEGPLPTQDPLAAAWDEAPRSEFPLSPQVHWPDRIQEVTVKGVAARALHNGEEIAIRLKYDDPSEDAQDAAALEFMVGDKKAHFAHAQEMLQVEGGPVNIWYWKNAEGPKDLYAKGFGTLRPHEQQNVQATGTWQDGVWYVVFSRPLSTGDPEDVQIVPGDWSNIAFAIWDGKLVDEVPKEQGSQKAVSSWWYFRAEPGQDLSVFGYALLGLGIAVALELVIVRKLRKGSSA